MTLMNLQPRPYPLGAHEEEGRLRFAYVSREKECGILLHDRRTGRFLQKIPFTEKDRIGEVYCRYVEGFERDKIAYRFYEGDKEIPDERARMFLGRYQYGKERKKNALLAVFPKSDFDWEQDERPHIPYENCLCYCMHVRGFTKHPSSKVLQKGTFRGVTEKIDYLKETGVTTVELQPAYEFLEIPDLEELKQTMPFPVAEKDLAEMSARKLNYWGYKKGFYYAPKSAYAASEDAVTEYKEMIKTFHQNGMEVVMQFYFPKEVAAAEILEILRFWVLEYHVDGFHLMGDQIPVNLVAQDPLLSDTKLWYYSFDVDYLYGDHTPAFKNLAFYNDDYLYAMRKFLKGDENMLDTIQYQMRHIPKNSGRIHYLSNYYGFTLMDLVSYDRKHNEENGEDNRDGNDFNCSWNCGAEGATRKKKILDLRRRQYKNAVLMLLFTQSTPLIFMGDEFGNSQKGNNNPYCQDNAVAWLNWNDLEKHRELYEFWKMCVELRKGHPILHPQDAFRIMDYIACGYPDLSYHGQNAWRAQTEGYNRHIGMMFCGKYVQREGGEDDFFYLAINMHWEPHMLALPKLPKGLKWELACVSGGLQDALTINKSQTDEKERLQASAGGDIPEEYVRLIAGRSMAVFSGVADESSTKCEAAKKRTRKGSKN